MSSLRSSREYCGRAVQRLSELDPFVQEPEEVLHIHKHEDHYELNPNGVATGSEWWWLTYRGVDGLLYELEFSYDGSFDSFPEGRLDMVYYDLL